MTKSIYNKVIDSLMQNDKNSSLDTVLKECDNDLEYAVSTLKLILNRIVNEEDLSKEESNFYKYQLEKLGE